VDDSSKAAKDKTSGTAPRLNLWWAFGLAVFGGAGVVVLLLRLHAKDSLNFSADIRSLPYAVSALVLLPAAYLTYIRQRSLEAKHQLESRIENSREADLEVANGRADEAAFRARFTEACILLGSAEATVRLGGVSALAGLADEWGRVDDPDTTDDRKAHRQQCIDVLCGHLRLPYDPTSGSASTVVTERTWPAGVAGALRPDGITKETRTYQRLLNDREVRLTIISTITAHLQEYAPVPWHGHNFDFTGATFDGGSFDSAVFSGGKVNFTGAQFSGGSVDFTEARFSGGTVDFTEARFSGGTVEFTEAEFAGGTVNFTGAEFAGGTVNFNRARLTCGTVDFTEARFAGGTVTLNNVRFYSGSLRFSDANFSGSSVTFSGANFTDCSVTFAKAKFTGGTVGFEEAIFAGRDVVFDDVICTGGSVSFDDAKFSGGQVTRDGNEFRGYRPPEVIPSV